MIKIFKRGILKEDRTYLQECPSCQCQFSYQKTEIQSETVTKTDPRNEEYEDTGYFVICPTKGCEHKIMHRENNVFNP